MRRRTFIGTGTGGSGTVTGTGTAGQFAIFTSSSAIGDGGSIAGQQVAFGSGTSIAGSEDFKWDDSTKSLGVTGIAGIGTLTPLEPFTGAALSDSILTVYGSAYPASNQMYVIQRRSYATISLGRHNGTTASPENVSNGNALGEYQMGAWYENNYYTDAAVIKGSVDGSPGNYVPTMIELTTHEKEENADRAWFFNSTGNLSLPGPLTYRGATSGSITHSVPATITSYEIKWPSAQGTAGQFLKIASVAGSVLTMEWGT